MGAIQNSFNQVLSMAAVGAGFAKKSAEDNARITEGLKAEQKELEKQKSDIGFEKQEEYKKMGEADEDIALLKFNYNEEQKNLSSIKREKPRTDWGKEDRDRRRKASEESLKNYVSEIGQKRGQIDSFYDRIRILQKNMSDVDKEIAGVQGKLDFQKNKVKYGLFAKGGKK